MKVLKKQYLRLADQQELLNGKVGEIVTADVIKPYLDLLDTKLDNSQVQLLVNALENKLLNGVGMDGDTLSELYDKITALKDLSSADVTGIMQALALKADENSVAQRLAEKADKIATQTALDAKADKTAMQTALDAKADESTVVERLATKADAVATAEAIATKLTETQVTAIATQKAQEVENRILDSVSIDGNSLKKLKALLDQAATMSENDKTQIVESLALKLDKTVFYSIFSEFTAKDGSTQYDVNFGNVRNFIAQYVETDELVLKSLKDATKQETAVSLQGDILGGNSKMLMIGSNFDGSIKGMGLAPFLAFVANNSDSAVAQVLKDLTTRLETIENYFEEE